MPNTIADLDAAHEAIAEALVSALEAWELAYHKSPPANRPALMTLHDRISDIGYAYRQARDARTNLAATLASK